MSMMLTHAWRTWLLELRVIYDSTVLPLKSEFIGWALPTQIIKVLLEVSEKLLEFEFLLIDRWYR